MAGPQGGTKGPPTGVRAHGHSRTDGPGLGMAGSLGRLSSQAPPGGELFDHSGTRPTLAEPSGGTRGAVDLPHPTSRRPRAGLAGLVRAYLLAAAVCLRWAALSGQGRWRGFPEAFSADVKP